MDSTITIFLYRAINFIDACIVFFSSLSDPMKGGEAAQQVWRERFRTLPFCERTVFIYGRIHAHLSKVHSKGMKITLRETGLCLTMCTINRIL